MDEKTMPLTAECLPAGVEDAHLRELPALLPAASALSEAVLRNLPPEVAQEIQAQGEAGCHWQVDTKLTTPCEWNLFWCTRRDLPQRIAGGAGAGELEADVIHAAAAFLQVAVAKITSEERLVLARMLAEGRGVVYVTCSFGPRTSWRLAAHLQIWGAKAEGLYAIGPALHQTPPERAR